MRKHLLGGTAVVALFAGISLAVAQGTGGAGGAGGAGGGSPGGASSGGGGAGARGGAGGAATESRPGGTGAGGVTGAGERGSTTGASEKPSTTQPGQAGQGAAPRTGAGSGEKAAPTGQAQPNRTGTGAGERAGERTGAGATGGERAGTATGARGAGGGRAANITTEQRTQIRSTLLRGGNVNRVTNLNVRVAVGTALPRDVVIRPLPPEIVTLVPEYRGYDYIVYNDEIIIIEPSTREIVYIIEG